MKKKIHTQRIATFPYGLVQFAGTLMLFTLLQSCGHSKTEHDATGTFEATEIVVSSEANGKIISFQIDEGQTLTANQKIGAIDSIQLYLRKKQLATNIGSIESRRPEIDKQIAAIEQQIATQKHEKQRIERLLKANAANQKNLDDINAQIAVLEKQLDAQKSTLTNTNRGINDDAEGVQLQIAQLNDQLKKCQIINPINGSVLVKYAEENEVTTIGKPLYKIADTKTMILRAYITADQLTKIKIGQKVNVFSDFGEDNSKQYAGTITWISNKAEFTPKTIQTRDERANLVYAVKIEVKNDGLLKIGMYGEIDFSTDQN